MPAEKGSYRSVYSAIWDDPEFQAFDADAMAVFFCLRTSKDCNFPCIFTHYHTTLYERMPHIERERIDTGINTLIKAGWIRYDRPVLWIVKGLKNEPNYYPNNPKHILGIVKILRSLPKLNIVEEFATYYGIPFKFDPSRDTRTDTCKDTGTSTRSDTPPIQGTGTGTGTGTGKGLKDLPRPVDNSNVPLLDDGADDRGNAEGHPPVAPTPELLKAQGKLIEERKARGIPEDGNSKPTHLLAGSKAPAIPINPPATGADLIAQAMATAHRIPGAGS